MSVAAPFFAAVWIISMMIAGFCDNMRHRDVPAPTGPAATFWHIADVTFIGLGMLALNEAFFQ